MIRFPHPWLTCAVQQKRFWLTIKLKESTLNQATHLDSMNVCPSNLRSLDLLMKENGNEHSRDELKIAANSVCTRFGILSR